MLLPWLEDGKDQYIRYNPRYDGDSARERECPSDPRRIRILPRKAEWRAYSPCSRWPKRGACDQQRFSNDRRNDRFSFDDICFFYFRDSWLLSSLVFGTLPIIIFSRFRKIMLWILKTTWKYPGSFEKWQYAQKRLFFKQTLKNFCFLLIFFEKPIPFSNKRCYNIKVSIRLFYYFYDKRGFILWKEKIWETLRSSRTLTTVKQLL